MHNNIIEQTLGHLTLGLPQAIHNLAVHPLLAEADGAPGYLTFDQAALNARLARVTEISAGGHVPKLAFERRSRAFSPSALRLPRRAIRRVGQGRTRLEGEALTGGAPEHDGRLVHLAAYRVGVHDLWARLGPMVPRCSRPGHRGEGATPTGGAACLCGRPALGPMAQCCSRPNIVARCRSHNRWSGRR